MKTTLDLLDRAVAGGSYDALSIELGLARSTLRQAQGRGNLSPTIAGKLAARLGLDVPYWMAKATIEAAGQNSALRGLRRALAEREGFEPSSRENP
jgi:hypothetical protein